MFTPERKLRIVLEGLKEGHSKRIFAAKYHIHENNYYNWKKILLTTASKVFKGTFTLLHKDVVRQMDLVIANQKKLIDKQKEMIQRCPGQRCVCFAKFLTKWLFITAIFNIIFLYNKKYVLAVTK